MIFTFTVSSTSKANHAIQYTRWQADAEEVQNRIEKDEALRLRDAAIVERDIAVSERDTALAEVEKLSLQCDKMTEDFQSLSNHCELLLEEIEQV